MRKGILRNGKVLEKLHDLAKSRKGPSLVAHNSEVDEDGLSYSFLHLGYPNEPFAAEFRAVSGSYSGKNPNYAGRKVDAVAAVGYDPRNIPKQERKLSLRIESNKKRERHLAGRDRGDEILYLVDLMVMFETRLGMTESQLALGRVPLDERGTCSRFIERCENAIEALGKTISSVGSAIPHKKYDLAPVVE